MQPPANSWSRSLQEARKNLRLSRAALAGRAGVSPQTVKAYELGLRQPSRSLLNALLKALKLDRATRDEILVSAGFAPIGAKIGPAVHPDYRYTEAEAQAYLDTLPWPAWVVDDLMRVVVANDAAGAVWGIDLIKEVPDIDRRNMMRFASDPRFADRVINWDEVVGMGISVFKGHHLGAETLEAPSTFFARVLEDLVQGDPRYVARFFQLFASVEPRTPKVRWGFPVTWTDPLVGEMHFTCVVTEANEPKGHAFNDWVPVDAETWERLEALKKRRS